MRRFVAAFFRHPFLLILPAIIIPLIVVFVVRSLASSYTSSATVYVVKAAVNTGDNPFSTPAQNLNAGLAEAIKSQQSFVLKIANQTDMPKTYPKGTAGVDGLMVARIRAGMTITTTGTHYIVITYNDPDPRIAAQVVNAVLPAYIAQSIEFAQQNADNLIAEYRSQLADAQNQYITDSNQYKDYIQQHPDVNPDTDPSLAQLQAAVKSDLNNIQTYNTKIQNLTNNTDILSNVPSYSVTDPGLVPTAPTVKTKTTITAMIGGVALGLGTSLGLIGLLALWDRRIHSRDDLEEAVDLQVLEVVPNLSGLRDDEAAVGSEDTLMHLAQVPVLATLPRFAESLATQETSQTLSNRAEEA
jgi:capsular polysaccharide biosynthesis protein